MIIDKEILIKTKGSKLKYLKDIGYDVSLDEILIPVNVLPKYSSCIVNVKCDYCGLESTMEYRFYNISLKSGGTYACSRKCAKIKRDNNNFKKYGYKNVFEISKIKEQIKDTNLEKYGVEYPTQSINIKNKVKNTNLEKYGGTGNGSIVISDKIKNTNLEKYGTDIASKSEYVKLKIKESLLSRSENEIQSSINQSKSTCLEKYGVEFISKIPEVKEKVKNTIFNNYGGFGFSSDIIYNKIKNTNIERYGVEFTSQNDEIKSKVKSTSIKRSMNDEFRKNNYEIAKNFNYIKYLGNRISLFRCDKNLDHNFEIDKDNYYNRIRSKIPLCTVCNPVGDSSSVKQKELLEYIISVYNGKIISNYRDSIEIDIYLPDLNLGFEFNGLYYHSDKFKDKYYHLNKFNHFKDRGIRIIFIWEDSWDLKKEIVMSQISNWLGKTYNRIYARKTDFRVITDVTVVRKFLNDNHIQGFINSSIKIGLFYNDELVSLMTFDKLEGRSKMKDNEYNLSRFVNKINTVVIGSASKLIKNFISVYSPERIISFADKDWSIGNLYYSLGFNKIGESEPDYKYIINNVRKNKQNYQMNRLSKSISEGKTEKEIMENSGYSRVYDCGKLKFEIKI